MNCPPDMAASFLRRWQEESTVWLFRFLGHDSVFQLAALLQLLTLMKVCKFPCSRSKDNQEKLQPLRVKF